MHEITENASLEMTNVLSFRGKVTQQRMGDIAKEMADIIKINGAQKTMSGVSATFAVDTSGSEPELDIEIMYPLDRDIYVPAPYTIKPVFRLRNAVKIRHMGNPATMQETANELMQYIKFKKLTPITAGYNVTVQEPSGPYDVDSLIADIYIGISDNIL
ncbi:MAG: AraC family transcriptional regulator [Ruminococcus sp.]|nr:AraC family transcriptional regulator [Ruminococcus sp.]